MVNEILPLYDQRTPLLETSNNYHNNNTYKQGITKEQINIELNLSVDLLEILFACIESQVIPLIIPSNYN